MDHKTAQELSAELNVAKQFVTVTIGLDTGRLVKSSTHVYFIAPRMGGWEIIEESSLLDVAKVEKKTNFMGDTFILHTKSGRWTCKDIEDEMDVRKWFGQAGASSVSGTQRTVKLQDNQPAQSTTPKKPRRTPTSPKRSTESSFGGSLTPSAFEEDNLPKLSPDLQSIFNTLSNQPTTENTRAPTPVPDLVEETFDTSVKNSDLSELESADDGSSCVVTLLKWGFYIWIFSSFFDLCS